MRRRIGLGILLTLLIGLGAARCMPRSEAHVASTICPAALEGRKLLGAYRAFDGTGRRCVYRSRRIRT